MAARIPESADRDFTASALVVDDGRVLLVDHGKLGRWIQPGGHIEPRETPDEAARRETFEETGVRVEIRTPHAADHSFEHRENLPEPFRINLHEVRDTHWHVDFAYLGRAAERTGDGEEMEQRWFSVDDLEDGGFALDENTRRMAAHAIRAVDG